MDELEEAELEMEALLLAVAELVEGAEHDGEEAGELIFREEGGRTGGAVALFGGDLQQVGGGAGGFVVGAEVGDFGDDAVAEVTDELAGELRCAVAGVEQAVDGGDDVCAGVVVDGFEHLLVDDVRDRAHELANLVDFEGGAAVDERC